MMTINYQTATAEEITNYFNTVIVKAVKELADSPKSLGVIVQNSIGFYQGVMATRGFTYDCSETTWKWAELY
jgi:hypothetical protein